MNSHVDSGERCMVAHWKNGILQAPCIKCSRCHEFILPEHFDKECYGPRTLDGIEPPHPTNLPRNSGRIHYMHRVFKMTEHRTCDECLFLVRSAGYLKCSKYGISSGPGTDWRKKWQACGLFEALVKVEP